MSGKAQLMFSHPELKGIVTTVGSVVRNFSEDASLYGLTEKESSRLSRAVGLNERRVVGDKLTTTSDLCVQSAKYLLENLNIQPDSIDGIIFVSQTPDYSAPSTAISMQYRLGLPITSMAFDMRLGCSGFVYGLSVAYSLIESGLTRVLLCVGDVASRFVPENDHTITPIMGDAGSAIFIERGKAESFFQMYSDGTGSRSLYIPNSGLRYLDEDKELMQTMHMNGAEVFNFTLQRVPTMIESILEYSKVAAQDIDYFVLHQPNKYILNSIQKRLGVSDSKFPKDTQSVYGNQNSASIPGTISGFLNNAYSTEKLISMFSGFGIGLSWASCIVNTENIFAPDVLTEGNFHE
jgi:3-oxoacyl-[acyl-carrier-protein] synthase-3